MAILNGSKIKLKDIYLIDGGKGASAMLKVFSDNILNKGKEAAMDDFSLKGYVFWGNQILADKTTWNKNKATVFELMAKWVKAKEGVDPKDVRIKTRKAISELAERDKVKVGKVKLKSAILITKSSKKILKEEILAYCNSRGGSSVSLEDRFVLAGQLLMKKSEYKYWKENGGIKGASTSMDVPFQQIFPDESEAKSALDTITPKYLIDSGSVKAEKTPKSIKVTHGADVLIKKMKAKKDKGGDAGIDLSALKLWNNCLLTRSEIMTIRKSNLFNIFKGFYPKVKSKIPEKDCSKFIKQKIAEDTEKPNSSLS